MASTVALFTGLSGLSTNSRRLDVIGNNISNVNTTAFKANRMQFAPAFSRNLSLGSSPVTNSGGTNPGQIGLGVSIAGTQRNFNNGSVTSTGIPTDVAIEGDGMFIVNFNGERMYTRDGSFQVNENNDLVTITGGRVMGFGVDDNFEIIEGNLEEINIPIGVMTVAEATRNVIFDGNLNASGEVATTGSIHTSRTFYTDNTLTTEVNIPVDFSTDDLWIEDSVGNPQLAIEGGAGTIITVSGIEKAGKDLGTHQFQFQDPPDAGIDNYGTTMTEFISWLEDITGINDTDLDGENLGGSITFVDGVLTITGNEGTVQDLTVESANIVATNNGAGIAQPFIMTKDGFADGESVRTSYVVYDSLGTPLTVDISAVLQSTSDSEGTAWSFIIESSDNDDVSRILGLGTIRFDSEGEFVEASNNIFTLTRENGAVSPLTIEIDFNSPDNNISSLTATASNLAAVFQDGSPIGTLNGFSIGDSGVIAGSFTNGLTRDIGQIALAKFTNPMGLVDSGTNMFRIGPNSGEAVITSPLEFGTGRLIGGALELSNVDLSQEFINMILASTGYSAASRVITTTDELIDQLLVLGR